MHLLSFTRIAVLLQLSAIWLRVLGQRRLSPWSNFFQSGGDSLAAVSCVEEIHHCFGVEATLDQLFQSSLYRLSGDVTTALPPGQRVRLTHAFLSYLSALRGQHTHSTEPGPSQNYSAFWCQPHRRLIPNH